MEDDLESRLRASQLYNRTLIESCPAAMFVVGPNLVVTDVNERFVKFAGVERRSLVGHPLYEAVEIASPAIQAIQRSFESRSAPEVSLRARHSPPEGGTLVGSGAIFSDPRGEDRAVFFALQS
jgi:PAS domain S-box-containing protein